MSKAYEIYKKSVGGITFNGDKMKDFSDLPEGIKNAWSDVDNHYEKIYKELHKNVITACINSFKNNIKNNEI